MARKRSRQDHPRNPARLDAYVRVSRVGERAGSDSYGSPQDQLEAIERWADYKQVAIAKVHTDEDQSGGTHERPGLEQAIARALSGETDGIVAYDISRFSRFTEHGLRDLHRLQDAGARLVFATEDIDTSTPHGKLIYTVLLATHEAALEQAKARWRVTKARGIREGRAIGPTPVGYTRERNGKHGKLVPHPTEGPAVSEAFRLAAMGDLRAAIAHLQEHIPTTSFVARKASTAKEYGVKQGDVVNIPKTWHAGTLRRLLSSRVYLGEARYMDPCGNCDACLAGKACTAPVERREGLINRKAHEPLTDLATWTAAQSTPEDRRAPAGSFPLSGGHTFCASCGRRLAGSRAGSKTRGDYQRRYKCISKRGCDAKANVKADLLEEHVLRLLRDLPPRPSGHAEPVAGADAARRELARLQQRLDDWRADDEERSRLGAAAFEAVAATYADEVEQARSRYEQLIKQATTLEPDADELMEATPDQLPDLLERLSLKVVVTKGRGDLADRVSLESRDLPA